MDKLINDFGYGIIPKRIMKDTNVSLQAKGIYSYLCSYAGNKGTAFPGVNLITHELGISKNTFYKYLKELKETGYVEVTQERSGKGTFNRNIYRLLPCPKKPYTVKPYTEKPYTVNKDTNNNSIKSNSINNNSIKDIYIFWNSQKIINHRKLTDKMKRKIKTTLKDYKEEEIKTAIKNYSEIVNDDKYYFKYRWTIDEFLQRGLEQFMNGEIARQNYLDESKVKRTKEIKNNWRGSDKWL